MGFVRDDSMDEDPDAIVKQLKAILDNGIPEKAPETHTERKKAFRPPRGAHLGIMLVQSLRSELRDTAGLEPPDEIVFREKPRQAPARKIIPKRAAIPSVAVPKPVAVTAPVSIPKPARVPEPAAIVRLVPKPIIKPIIAPEPEIKPVPRLIRRIAKFSPKKIAKARLLLRVPKRKVRKKIIAPKPKPKAKPVKARPKPMKAAQKPARRPKPARRMPKRKLSGRERLFRLLARRRRK